MKESNHSFGWKQLLCVALAAAILIAGGFGIKALLSRGSARGAEAAAAGNGSQLDQNAGEAGAAEPSWNYMRGEVDPEESRMNIYLTVFAQQGIENLETDLDEDAELLRFAFRYRSANDAKSVLEQEENGETVRILTLDQVNETLTKLLGRTLSPDREEYSVMSDGETVFRCAYKDGCFRQVSPDADADEDILRVAKVESYNAETGALRFRVYQILPANWVDWEVHIGLLPMIRLDEFEGDRRDIAAKIATGDAVLREVDGELRLMEYVSERVG